MQNHYAILGIPTSASLDEIKKAYKNLAKKYHPDVHKGDKNKEDYFKKINEAYQTLSDPIKKQRYDAYYLNPIPPSNPAPKKQYKPKTPSSKEKQEEAKLLKKYYTYTFIIALLVIILGTYFYYFMNDLSAQKFLEKGRQMERIQHYPSALQSYLSALEFDKDNPIALEKSADLFIQINKNYTIAVEHYILSYAHHRSMNDKLRVHYKYIDALIKSNQNYKAESSILSLPYDTLRKSYTDSLNFLQLLILNEKNNPQETLKFIDILLTNQEETYPILLLKARNQLQQSDTTGCIITLAELREKYPNKGATYYYNAFLYIFKKQYPLACEELSIGYQLDQELPRHPFDVYCNTP
ncbi:MAG: DnaJ domain-containing protein [Cytophagaceae bacterium]|jgi:curved DNA-binding protein CbpA|nr:DnaJ domain-containing protein [Cytophagaceae bacterium]